ncbi:Retrovirus-related Pol polyprotein from transposon RE1 [Abeliophyllum distichum]|uniref:Retrovirus-related Pol polyprotein from transposon RE1 n=1 Tax=Abeliophyllum distichum TaxID=126358 RepID=A0ABD1V2A1_9LAMI
MTSSLQGEFQNEEVNWLATTWLESEGVSEQLPSDGNTKVRLTKEHCPVEEPTIEEPCNMECNETPAPVNDITSRDTTTSDGSPSLVPKGPSPENVAELSFPAISLVIDNVNSTVQYALPIRHNCGNPPSDTLRK